MISEQKSALIVKIDYDEQDPYLLARKLSQLGDIPLWVRTSATKGIHIKLVTGSRTSKEVIRYMLDDPFRVLYDESRKERNLAKQFSSVLWDFKNGHFAGVWMETTAQDFANYLLSSGFRTVRNAVNNLTFHLSPIDWATLANGKW